MSRAVPVQDRPGPIVEHHLDALDFTPGDALKAGPGRKELPQEPVGVLVRAPLPMEDRNGVGSLFLRAS